MRVTPYFEIYRDSDGWRWAYLTANHKPIAVSEGEAYPRRKDCEDAIDLVKGSRHAPVQLGER